LHIHTQQYPTPPMHSYKHVYIPDYTYPRFVQQLFYHSQVFSYQRVNCTQLEVQSIHSTMHLRAYKPWQFAHHQGQKHAQSVAAIHLQSCGDRTGDPRVREQVALAQPCRRNWISTMSPVTIGVSPVKHTSSSAAQRVMTN